MKKKSNNENNATAIRPIIEMSERQLIAEKFRKKGLDCTVDSGVIRFYVGMDKKKDIESMLDQEGYEASWGVYPLRENNQ